MTTLLENTSPSVEADSIPWSRGIEKILADAPADMSYRLMMSRDDRIDTYLLGLLEDGAGCRQHTWSTVYRHSAHPGAMSAKPCTDSCNVRGEPTCRRDRAIRDLSKHRERFEAAYASGALRIRLTGPAEWGPNEFVEEVQKWERRRPVKRALPPVFGQFHVDDRGWYGLTLLVPDRKTVNAIADLWPDSKGYIFENGAEMPDAFEAAVDLKVEAEAGVFELVDSGGLTPGRARVILESEFGRRRTKFAGGFLTVTSVVGSPDASEIVPFLGADLDDMDEPPEAKAPTEESLLGRVSWAERELAGHWIPDSSIEMILRQVIAQATSRGFTTAKQAAEEALAHIPESNFNCPVHPQCRLEETDLRIKTRHLRKAVEYGEADWDGTNGIYTWTVEEWPQWSDRAVKQEMAS